MPFDLQKFVDSIRSIKEDVKKTEEQIKSLYTNNDWLIVVSVTGVDLSDLTARIRIVESGGTVIPAWVRLSDLLPVMKKEESSDEA